MNTLYLITGAAGYLGGEVCRDGGTRDECQGIGFAER